MNNKFTILINILDKLRYEAPTEYKKYYPEDGDTEKLNQARSRAYIHLFLKVKFGLLDFIDRENHITDGTEDGGIDAYYIDESEQSLGHALLKNVAYLKYPLNWGRLKTGGGSVCPSNILFRRYPEILPYLTIGLHSPSGL